MKYLIYVFLFFSIGLKAQSHQIVYLHNSEVYSLNKAKEQVQFICSRLGVINDFKVRSFNSSKIAEPHIKGNKRYLYVNLDRMQFIYEQGDKNDWSTIAVLVHEIGHFHNNDIKNIHSRGMLSMELKADYFAGFNLYKMGASLEESLLVLNFMNESDGATFVNGRYHSSHPPKSLRIIQITKGWNTAKSFDNSNK